MVQARTCFSKLSKSGSGFASAWRACFFWWECLVQGRRRMGIEIVRDKDYLFHPWVQGIGRILQDIRKIQRCPCLCHNRLPPACQRFRNHEDIRYTVAYIDRIHLFRLTRSAGDSGFLYELLVRFIYTDNRAQRVIRPLVNLQYILHFCYKFSVCLGDTPFFYKPRFDFVFFMTSQIVVSVM